MDGQLKIQNQKTTAGKLLIILAAVFLLSGCASKTSTVTVTDEIINTSTESVATTDKITTSSAKNDEKNVIKPTSTKNTELAKPIVTTTLKQITVPTELELPVGFAQQAPFANWDTVHEEACEEASMIMAVRYFKDQPISEKIMEEDLQKIFKWEQDNGYQVDLMAAETIKVLKDYYGFLAKVTTEVTADRIKYELAKGNLIIVPAAGRELKNPNFKTPGPIYHMLLIKGYDETRFITNDPGTRRGNSYRYNYNDLLQAVHNWNHERAQGGMTDAEMSQGERVMIVVSR